jgi:hypothetical protein
MWYCCRFWTILPIPLLVNNICDAGLNLRSLLRSGKLFKFHKSLRRRRSSGRNGEFILLMKQHHEMPLISRMTVFA